MRIGMEAAGMESAGRRSATGAINSRLGGRKYAQAMEGGNTAWMAGGSRILQMNAASGKGPGEENGDDKDEGKETGSRVRSEAEMIYQAAAAGRENPIKQIRQTPKVPYEHLAVNGVITYNGVSFFCDEETNSICLGDMTDKENVLTIKLSGGGHLKVNRNNIGDLSRAAGMFSPEDLNLILRAIAKDTKIQSMKKEIEDAEASVGNLITQGRQGDDVQAEGAEDCEAD